MHAGAVHHTRSRSARWRSPIGSGGQRCSSYPPVRPPATSVARILRSVNTRAYLSLATELRRRCLKHPTDRFDSLTRPIPVTGRLAARDERNEPRARMPDSSCPKSGIHLLLRTPNAMSEALTGEAFTLDRCDAVASNRPFNPRQRRGACEPSPMLRREYAILETPCRVAMTQNITSSATQTIDGMALATGDRAGQCPLSRFALGFEFGERYLEAPLPARWNGPCCRIVCEP